MRSTSILQLNVVNPLTAAASALAAVKPVCLTKTLFIIVFLEHRTHNDANQTVTKNNHTDNKSIIEAFKNKVRKRAAKEIQETSDMHQIRRSTSSK